MNLIEQLGGYEKASEDFKKLHLNLKEQQKSNKVFMDAFDALKTELLEYRRQHNIFEAGDDVFCENLDGVIRVINVYEDGLVIDTGIKTTPDSRNTMVMALPANMFRHATDAEIKVGKRLEVNQ